MGISVESLLGPLSEESPCGEDISFDPAFLELEQAFEGKPELQMGDSVREAEEPEWPDVRRRSLELLERSRNLRVIVQLTVAAMNTDGPEGLEAGLHLLQDAVDTYWSTVHPELDPDDDNDPTERINILASIVSPIGQTGDPVRFRERFREMPLISSRMFGGVSARDVQRAEDGGGGSGPDSGTIQAVVMEAELDDLIAAREKLVAARAHVDAVDRALTEHVGAASAVDFGDLLHDMDDARGIVDRWLTLRGHVAGGPAPDHGAEAATGEPADAGVPTAGVAVAAPPAPPAPAPGTINGPGDVLKSMGRIIEYYRDHEPSSPVPLVLEVARSLVSKSFVEISNTLTPDTVQVLQQIMGESFDD